MALPDAIVKPVTALGHGAAIAHLEDWIAFHGLEIYQTDAEEIPTFQVVVPGRPVHPLLTLQPPPNNPDIPFQKMRVMARSPLSNAGPRLFILQALNAVLPESEQKPEGHKDRFFKLKWAILADPSQFAAVRGVMDKIIQKIRAA
jgi:hypothetical protein